MANVWGAKYHEAKEGNKVWRLVVPKNMQLNPLQFEQFIAKQSGLDSGFRIRKKSLWTGFVQHQEDLQHEKQTKKTFIFAENIGLQDNVNIGDRTTERYVFSSHLILDYTGKKLEPVDVVLLPTLSLKINAPVLLKTANFVPSGRDVFAGITRVSTPGPNFYACQFGLAAGMVLFHGKLTRKVTCGQLPVV